MIELRGSLRTRIVLAFTVSLLVLSIAWSLGTFIALRLAEDRVLERQLELIVEDHRRQIETYSKADHTDSALDPSQLEIGGLAGAFITSYRDPRDLPPDLVPWALASPAAGFYEFTEEEFHVAVLEADSSGTARFLVFDVSGIEAPSSEDTFWYIGFAALALLIGLGAMAIGLVIGQFSVEPMVRLAEIVAEVDPESVGESDRERIKKHRFGRNEAGLLANAIERMMTRICAFIERERTFTAAASHELRTPTTVIGGALELLEREKQPVRVRRIHERIRYANTSMQYTIEMFLAMARESSGRQVADEEIRVLSVVEKTVEDCKPLLMRAKGCLVDIQTDADPVFYGHTLAFTTVVGNLLRNAIEHGKSKDECSMIVIRVDDCELVVCNPSENSPESEPPASRNSGLGLEIVHRLCECNGWSFDLTAKIGEMEARIAWVR